MIMASSKEAEEACALVTIKNLQKRFADKLDALSREFGKGKKFEKVTWLRDEGTHGGGAIDLKQETKSSLMRQVLMSPRFIMMI